MSNETHAPAIQWHYYPFEVDVLDCRHAIETVGSGEPGTIITEYLPPRFAGADVRRYYVPTPDDVELLRPYTNPQLPKWEVVRGIAQIALIDNGESPEAAIKTMTVMNVLKALAVRAEADRRAADVPQVWRSAKWIDRATNGGVTTDNLRQWVSRGDLRDGHVIQPGRENLYDLEAVAELRPQYAAPLREEIARECDGV
ncbi:MAG: hypothetical protein KJN71_06645 [Acidimicrobiia bacterium]|nr:hypothetical protein [Acidimicrobiia bacterium]